MGLQWSEVTPGREWVGHGVDGHRYAVVTEGSGRFGLYIEPRGCPHAGGLWLGGGTVYATAEDATDAADRYVVAHLDVHPPREAHDDRPQVVDEGERSMLAAGWGRPGSAMT